MNQLKNHDSLKKVDRMSDIIRNDKKHVFHLLIKNHPGMFWKTCHTSNRQWICPVLNRAILL